MKVDFDPDAEPVVIEDEDDDKAEDYQAAHTRRERAAADREEYHRDIAKIERDQLRGKLVTSKEAKAAAAAVRDAFMALGKQLWGRTDELLGDLPASEKQRLAQAQGQAWTDLINKLSL